MGAKIKSCSGLVRFVVRKYPQQNAGGGKVCAKDANVAGTGSTRPATASVLKEAEGRPACLHA